MNAYLDFMSVARATGSLIMLAALVVACASPEDPPLGHGESSGSSGATGEPDGASSTGASEGGGPTEAGETSMPDATSDGDVEPDDESSGDTTGEEVGEPPPPIVRGRVSLIQVDSSFGSQPLVGVSVDALYLHDDDVVFGTPENLDDTCTVWVHDVADTEYIDQGEIFVPEFAGNRPCRATPDGYRCRDISRSLEAGVAVAPAADGQMLLGPAASMVSGQFINTEFLLSGFSALQNNGRFPVVQHAYSQFATLLNAEATSEVLEDSASYVVLRGRNPSALATDVIPDVPVLQVSKDLGLHTPALSVEIAGHGTEFMLTPQSDDPLQPGVAERAYFCGNDCGVRADSSRWVYERRITDQSSEYLSGLAPAESVFAALECRGATGSHALTVPVEALQALHDAAADWPEQSFDTRLSRVAEVESGPTIVRAGHGIAG
ncbi:MAG: hypothetical protein AAF721_09870 [Myxococcota bacterium]